MVISTTCSILGIQHLVLIQGGVQVLVIIITILIANHVTRGGSYAEIDHCVRRVFFCSCFGVGVSEHDNSEFSMGWVYGYLSVSATVILPPEDSVRL